MKISIHEEQSIFHHTSNMIKTKDRDVSIIARFDKPLIVLLGNVLSHEECDELINLSKDTLKRSKTGINRKVNEIRTSSGTFFESQKSEFIHTIENRIATIMNVPVEHAEGLHILRYKPGEEYKEHVDYFTSNYQTRSDNRISTLVMYLNDVEEGGETFFPKLNLSISPQKGMAVYFEYFYQNTDLNERTLHSSTPVIRGEKWVATQWMRKQRFQHL